MQQLRQAKQQLRQAKAFGSFETNAKLAHAARESWPILWRGAWHDEMADLNASDLDSARRMIEGTARSMGMEVEG